MIQSEKLGLKVRSPVEYLRPGIKLKWSGREDRKLGRPAGRAFHALMSNQARVHCLAAFPKAICEPAWEGSFRRRIPSVDSSISVRLQ